MPAKYRPDQDAHRRLRHAAWKGDVRLARSMLARGAKLEATDGDQYTPLLIAARWNRIDMVKFLLEESGAKMTAKNNEGDNAYNLAILYGHTELARYLDESGCDTAENSLRQSRKASTDEWLAMAVRRTPSNTEISKMREKVHKNYSALEKEKTKAGKGTPPAQSTEDMAASAAAVEAATGLEGEEAAKHMDAGAPVGQISFPVGQRVVKKAPHACRLGIGSMGLAMFDGVVPVATWPYKYIDAVVVQSGSKSSKVVLMLNSGKMRKIAFQTLRPDELAAAIESKMDELAMHQATSPTWTPRMGDARVSHGGAMSPEPEPEPEPELDSSPTGSDSKITLDDDRSIWVGGIPESLIVMDMTASEDEIDIESSPLAKLFAGFGAIVSLTTRQKPGLNRSWAFITFENAASVEKALKAKPVKHGSVQLEIKKADVEEQLQRSETGALADVWRRQQEKEMKWMQSLLHGMHNDESYKAAKARVGAAMGLRPEEIDEVLEMQEMEELRGRSVGLSARASKSPKKKGPVVPLPSAPLSLSLDITDSDEEDSDDSSESSESSSSDSSSDSDLSDMDSFDTAQVVARRKVLAGHVDVMPVKGTATRGRASPRAAAGLGMPPSGTSPRPSQALAIE